jgi:hypothetical protein
MVSLIQNNWGIKGKKWVKIEQIKIKGVIITGAGE